MYACVFLLAVYVLCFFFLYLPGPRTHNFKILLQRAGDGTQEDCFKVKLHFLIPETSSLEQMMGAESVVIKYLNLKAPVFLLLDLLVIVPLDPLIKHLVTKVFLSRNNRN